MEKKITPNDTVEAQENRFKKLLFNEITAIVALVAIVVGVMNWVNKPVSATNTDIAVIKKDISFIKDDIDTINNNHLTHLQQYAEELKDVEEDNDRQDNIINEVNVKLERILTILDPNYKY